MAFKFRLEAALKYRASVVDQKQRDLAGINILLQRENEKLENLINKRKRNSENYSSNLNRLLPEEMIFYGNFFKGVGAEIAYQKKVVSENQKKVDEKREILIEAVKQKRIIETVKKKALVEYMRTEKKKEEAYLNDVAMTRFRK